jgi:hypothetical protein
MYINNLYLIQNVSIRIIRHLKWKLIPIQIINIRVTMYKINIKATLKYIYKIPSKIAKHKVIKLYM